MKILGIIPARYGSSRFPGKPLININGKTMISRVYQQATKVAALNHVLVATDDERIKKEVTGFGGNVVLTSTNHKSGTDRCLEAYEKQAEKYDVVINIQGDEPFINPEQIEAVCRCFSNSNTKIATLIKKIDAEKDLFDENKVKVVINKNKQALYFSRNAIPFVKGEEKSKWLIKRNYYKHIGIYGFTTKTLKEITKIPVSSLELAEGLEQLRWLENGYSINIKETEHEAISIDCPEDLKKIL